ncbi:MAG: transcriptional repressor NrdR [Rickettsiales bacterium]
MLVVDSVFRLLNKGSKIKRVKFINWQNIQFKLIRNLKNNKMKCPFCGNLESQVRDSRISDDSEAVKRRRYCPDCDSRFTTFERVQLREIMVIKKNGDKKIFDADKLKRSIEMAVRKRPVSPVQVNKLANNIVKKLETEGITETTSYKLGEMVLKALEGLDRVAYVRFASVYKNFEKTEDFREFIKKIAKSTEE